jgi:carbon-monoxide dehydrogenase large subunit
MINETIVRGQIHGGIGQGIGQALFEEFVYDSGGNPITSNFMDYSIPAASEMPSFEAHVTETPSPRNPLGAKGIAESGTIGAVPAIQNAVVDAIAHLGVRHVELPVTAERVWRAINAAATAR